MTEPFFEIIEGLDIEEPTDVVDYSTLDDVSLAEHYGLIRLTLHVTGALHDPNPTGKAADLHSQWAAINAEQRRRRSCEKE
jgi:hypothetical protein